MLMPKKVKYRKQQRGRMTGKAWRGSTLAFGDFGLKAMECGWIVTEVGRQPWVVYRLLTTAQAATTNGGVIATLTGVVVLYAILGVATIVIIRLLARRWRQGEDDVADIRYGPAEAGA